MSTTPNSTKDEVLYAFSVESHRSTSLLEEYINKYPQYRNELIDISIELSLSPKQVDMPVEGEVSDSVERSWVKFQSALEPSDPVSLSSHSVKHPLEALDNNSFRSLSKTLNLNRLFLTRLRDRTINASTIPRQLIEKIAKAIDTGFESIRDSLNEPPTVSPSVSFKAHGKPSASKQMTFDDAIESSNLSDEQKSELKAMK